MNNSSYFMYLQFITALLLQLYIIDGLIKMSPCEEVKIRGPDQGLGPIPASKNEVLGLIPETKKLCCGTNPSDY